MAHAPHNGKWPKAFTLAQACPRQARRKPPVQRVNAMAQTRKMFLQHPLSKHNEHGKGSYQADFNNSAHSIAAQATWRF